MRRTIALFLILAGAALVLAACGGDAVSPSTPDAETSPEKARVVVIDWPFMEDLQEAFATTAFVPHEITIQRTGGVYEVPVEGYPEDAPLRIVVPQNEAAARDGEPLTTSFRIWLPAVPRDGTFHFPGNCILYKTDNYPPINVPDIAVALPVLDCYGTAKDAKFFSHYALRETVYGYPFPAGVTRIYPEIDTPSAGGTPYVVISPLPGVGEPSSLTNGCIDPEVPGDEDGVVPPPPPPGEDD